MKGKLSTIQRGNLWHPPANSLYAFLGKVISLSSSKNLAVLSCAGSDLSKIICIK
jgi:hypothetical protein